VRRIASGRGRYNIPNIGLFLFRLRSYHVTSAPAYQLDSKRYLFSPLGQNMPLFTAPQTQEELSYLAQPINTPIPISRRALATYLNDYYGPDLSILLSENGAPVDQKDIAVCDLSDYKGSWAHTPPKAPTKYAIDPVLGRIACQTSPSNLRVSYHYGFSADMGGGDYPRAQTFDPSGQRVRSVPGPYPSIGPAITDALTDAATDPAHKGTVEITDNQRYAETLTITIAANLSLEVRADDQRRPTIALSSDFQISGDNGSEVTLNGLLITGGTLRVSGASGGQMHKVRLRHCTLVPGLTRSTAGDPQSPTAPSIIVESSGTILELDHCITGALRVSDTATAMIIDSIVDATSEQGIAYMSAAGVGAGGAMRVVRSTIIGKVWTTDIELASNDIFLARLASGDTWPAPVISDRRQEGCVRFSYIPPGSRVPRRYHCQPSSDATNSGALRVRPQFTSLRYGDPGYCQLSQRCAVEIREGGDDEAEMGAFHDLFQPQRLTNLRIRLDEYLRFGLEAGVLFAT
jgi:hypothetical protein